MKRTLILILIAILILAGFYALWRLYVSERRDRQRLEENPMGYESHPPGSHYA